MVRLHIPFDFGNWGRITKQRDAASPGWLQAQRHEPEEKRVSPALFSLSRTASDGDVASITAAKLRVWRKRETHLLIPWDKQTFTESQNSRGWKGPLWVI